MSKEDHRRVALLESLGKAVRDARASLGLSQEDLAEKAGLDRSYYGAVERGERNVAIVNLALIALALGVTLSELLVGVDISATWLEGTGGEEDARQ